MKRSNILVLLFVIFAYVSIYGAEKNSGIPTEEQVQKLAAAAWKEPIKSIDVTFYKDFTKVPEPVELLRKRAEEFADRNLGGRSLDELKPYELERRNKVIEENFKNWVESQKFPQKVKKRVRISFDSQRVDFVKVGPNEPLGLDTPFVHTFIKAKDANTGEFVSYHYAAEMNTVFIEKTKQPEETVIQFSGMPIISAMSLQFFLGTNQGSTPKSLNYIPDPNKIQELAKTGLVSIEPIKGAKATGNKSVSRIGIRPDPNAPDSRDIVEIGDPNHFPTVVLVCDKKDYSRTYRAEFRVPTMNQVALLRECSDFDSQGFPHNVTEVKYDKDGNFNEKSVYRIIKVELNPSIPAGVFEFNPPEGYKVVDQRPKKP